MQALEFLGQAMEGSRAGVTSFLGSFEHVSFLWQRDIATEYAKFVATKPKLKV